MFLELSLGGGKLLALFAADFVYVALEVAVFQELCDHVLLKGWDGAGVEAEACVEIDDKFFRQDHIAYTQRGGDGF